MAGSSRPRGSPTQARTRLPGQPQSPRLAEQGAVQLFRRFLAQLFLRLGEPGLFAGQVVLFTRIDQRSHD
jgi:hypothetical protein